MMTLESVVDILALAISSKAVLGGKGSKSVSMGCRHIGELPTFLCSEKQESDVSGDEDLTKKDSR